MVTKTMGKLHFDDLDPGRFEHLCLSLLYTYRRWDEINHLGESGSDDGIDIFATDTLENGKSRKWVIQCKRYNKFYVKDSKAVVDKLLSKNSFIPDTILIVVSCNVSKKTIETYKTYANIKGIKNPLIMTSSEMEAELYNKRHDLLFAYFGIDLNLVRNKRIETIKRRISMKRDFTNDFMNRNINRNNRSLGDTHKYSRLIIHSVDDTSYPNVDVDSFGISPWFTVEPFGFYNNGFEVIIGFKEALIYEDLTWDIIDCDEQVDHSQRIILIGRIPYSNVVAYDLEGDDYYGNPHIYCDFACNGEPYVEICYHPVDDWRFEVVKFLDVTKYIGD